MKAVISGTLLLGLAVGVFSQGGTVSVSQPKRTEEIKRQQAAEESFRRLENNQTNSDEDSFQFYILPELRLTKEQKLQTTPAKSDIKIIDVSKNEDCLEYSDYAFGSQYSLDLQRYLNINANLLLSKNRFSVPQNSYQSFQILMDLGNRNLSEINRKTKEVVELSKLKMIDRYGEFQMNKILESDNIKSNRISFSYQAKHDHIFLLRSVFGETSDWQRETIYAFQLVKIENNIATILWKKISSKWA